MNIETAVMVLQAVDEKLSKELEQQEGRKKEQYEYVKKLTDSNSTNDASYAIGTLNSTKARIGSITKIRHELIDMIFVDAVRSQHNDQVAYIQFVAHLGKKALHLKATFDVDIWRITISLPNGALTVEALKLIREAVVELPEWNFGKLDLKIPEVWIDIKNGVRGCDECLVYRSELQVDAEGNTKCATCLGREDESEVSVAGGVYYG